MSLPKHKPNKDNKHVKKNGKRPQGLQPNKKYYRQLRHAESEGMRGNWQRMSVETASYMTNQWQESILKRILKQRDGRSKCSEARTNLDNSLEKATRLEAQKVCKREVWDGVGKVGRIRSCTDSHSESPFYIWRADCKWIVFRGRHNQIYLLRKITGF